MYVCNSKCFYIWKLVFCFSCKIRKKSDVTYFWIFNDDIAIDVAHGSVYMLLFLLLLLLFSLLLTVGVIKLRATVCLFVFPFIHSFVYTTSTIPFIYSFIISFCSRRIHKLPYKYLSILIYMMYAYNVCMCCMFMKSILYFKNYLSLCHLIFALWITTKSKIKWNVKNEK